jgi:NAD(P)-dependent dehydrogenase (short-subunit alcohol dehydrogenase family)
MTEPKRIVITGVSRGLGRALVDEFANAGHTVAGCARSATAIWDLQQSHDSPHRFDTLDISDDAAVRGWAISLVNGFGVPDLIINNAGMINQSAPLWDVPIEEFRQLIDINLIGVFSVIRHLLPAMIERGSGVIVNLSSGWGRSVAADVAPYCMSKWGIEGLTRALAADLPAGLAAIPLNPGVVNTDMLQQCFGDDAATYQNTRQWACTAAPYIVSLGPEHNGEPVTVPG